MLQILKTKTGYTLGWRVAGKTLYDTRFSAHLDLFEARWLLRAETKDGSF